MTIKDLIGKLDVKPLTDIIGRLRGWPVLNNTQWFSNANHYHWLNTYIMMREIGITANSLIDLKVEKDVRNSSRFIAHIDQPVFHINITDNNQLDQYTKLMVTIATMMGVYETDARNEWLSVLEFQMKLIKVVYYSFMYCVQWLLILYLIFYSFPSHPKIVKTIHIIVIVI